MTKRIIIVILTLVVFICGIMLGVIINGTNTSEISFSTNKELNELISENLSQNDIENSKAEKYAKCYNIDWYGNESSKIYGGIYTAIYIDKPKFYSTNYTNVNIIETTSIDKSNNQTCITNLNSKIDNIEYPNILIYSNGNKIPFVENFGFYINNSGRIIGVTNYNKNTGILDFECLNLKEGDTITINGGVSVDFDNTGLELIRSRINVRNASGTDQTVEFIVKDKNNTQILTLTVVCPHFDWDTIY